MVGPVAVSALSGLPPAPGAGGSSAGAAARVIVCVESSPSQASAAVSARRAIARRGVGRCLMCMQRSSGEKGTVRPCAAGAPTRRSEG